MPTYAFHKAKAAAAVVASAAIQNGLIVAV